jgi:hypothetical protein
MTRSNTRFFNILSFTMLCALVGYVFFLPSVQALNQSNSEENSITDKKMAAHPYTNLRPFSASYVAFRSGKDIGNASLTLHSIKEDQYELIYQSKVSKFFLSDKRYEKTLFANSTGSLVPSEYIYKRSGTGSNKALSLIFDKSKKSIQINKGDENDTQYIFWDGEFDNQLFRVDFPQKLARGITSAQYSVINSRGEKRNYTLEVVGSDNLSIPYGNITAIKVLIGRDSRKRMTYAWFAPSLNFNLVRLQQFKDNKEQGDIQLETFTYIE